MARIDKDYYPTPAVVVDHLLSLVTFMPGDTFLEPCRGEAKMIWDRIPLPDSQKTFCELSEGKDYLKEDLPKFDVIITNPPFSASEDFLKKSKSELADNGTLIYLQRVNWLGSLKRIPLWEEVGLPNKFNILVPRVSFTGTKTDSTEYAWFIWDYGNRVNLPYGLSISQYRQKITCLST